MLWLGGVSAQVLRIVTVIKNREREREGERERERERE